MPVQQRYSYHAIFPYLEHPVATVRAICSDLVVKYRNMMILAIVQIETLKIYGNTVLVASVT